MGRFERAARIRAWSDREERGKGRLGDGAAAVSAGAGVQSYLQPAGCLCEFVMLIFSQMSLFCTPVTLADAR